MLLVGTGRRVGVDDGGRAGPGAPVSMRIPHPLFNVTCVKNKIWVKRSPFFTSIYCYFKAFKWDISLNTVALEKYFNNYSLDLLFSLPKQDMQVLAKDLKIIGDLNPPHVSAYCLTVKENHPMNRDRGSSQQQITMFEMVFEAMEKIGLRQYEISNFAKPGMESKHNSLYWDDMNYWGLGLSAHSYKRSPDWGYRFWNPSSYDAYMKMVGGLEESSDIEHSFQNQKFEKLQFHESLTDFCHTSLRKFPGLNMAFLRQKFGDSALSSVEPRLQSLKTKGFLESKEEHWTLSKKGLFLSNQVFEELLFSCSDIDNLQ